MNTDIEYLRQLETDLGDAAVRERSRLEPATGRERVGIGARPRSGSMWAKAAGVAAAFLVVAGAIGFMASGQSALEQFNQVGTAIDSAGGGGLAEPGVAPQASPPPTEEPRSAASNGRGSQQQDLSKIVRDGRIGVVVPDGSFGGAVGDLTFIAEEHGGFILSSSTQNERSGTFVLRIPANRFDQALSAIRDLGNVRFQTIEGDDVTAEFIDYQARLRILGARRAVLFDLSADANTISETLQLQNQLDDVQLRIEQIQGQLRFINDQVAEATLRVSIQERNAPKTAAEAVVDNPDLGSSFELAVQGSLRIVGAVIVGLGYLIPLTVLGALIWLAVWLVRRRAVRSA